MVENIIISVSKGYQIPRTRTKYGYHPRAKPIWYVYLFTDGIFRKKRISLLEVPLYRSQIRRKRDLICNTCEKSFVAYVKNDKEKVECPYCNE